MEVRVPAGVVTGVGSLPHIDARAAADFVLELLPELPAVPSLPRRSPAERILAHGLVGVRVMIDDAGDVRLDLDRLDPLAAIQLDPDHDAFGGLRAFLEAAVGRRGPVKWQVVGPVTLGLALMRRGAAGACLRRRHQGRPRTPPHRAAVGGRRAPRVPAGRRHRRARVQRRARARVPIPPDTAIDLTSGALAAIEQVAMMGVHCCADGDLAAIAATGPSILSMPVSPRWSRPGHLCSFLDAGGWIAWGAVPTDGPVGRSPERYLRSRRLVRW